MPQAQDPSGLPYFNRFADVQMGEALAGIDVPPFPPQTQYPLPTTDPALTPLTALPPPASTKPLATAPSTTSTAKTSTNSNSTTAPSTSSKATKKKYPCPHAARYGCPDTFTTSGHAARHGKKHTGEKNIHCPTCNKAFTRKDNMKQHERTHKASRAENPSPTTPVISTHKAPSATSRQQRPAPAITSSDSPVMRDADPPTMEFDGDSSKLEIFSPGQGRMVDAMQNIRPTPAQNGRLPSFSGRSEVDGEGDSPGLDALAHVASEMVG